MAFFKTKNNEGIERKDNSTRILVRYNSISGYKGRSLCVRTRTKYLSGYCTVILKVEVSVSRTDPTQQTQL
jgi:hypothetical protein